MKQIFLTICMFAYLSLSAQTYPFVELEPVLVSELMDTSVILRATAYSAGWGDLWVGGYLYQECDSIPCDTLVEQLVDLKVPYSYFQWFIHPLQPGTGYCWRAYHRYDTDWYPASDTIHFTTLVSPTRISEQDAKAVYGYFDSETKVFHARMNLRIQIISILGQSSELFFLQSGELKDVSHYSSPAFLILLNQQGRILGRIFIPD